MRHFLLHFCLCARLRRRRRSHWTWPKFWSPVIACNVHVHFNMRICASTNFSETCWWRFSITHKRMYYAILMKWYGNVSCPFCHTVMCVCVCIISGKHDLHALCLIPSPGRCHERIMNSVQRPQPANAAHMTALNQYKLSGIHIMFVNMSRKIITNMTMGMHLMCYAIKYALWQIWRRERNGGGMCIFRIYCI